MHVFYNLSILSAKARRGVEVIKKVNHLLYISLLAAGVIQILIMGSNVKELLHLTSYQASTGKYGPVPSIGTGPDLSSGTYRAFTFFVVAAIAFAILIALVSNDWRLLLGIGLIVGAIGMRFGDNLPSLEHSTWWIAPVACLLGIAFHPFYKGKERLATARSLA